jgi:hypothetical protein
MTTEIAIDTKLKNQLAPLPTELMKEMDQRVVIEKPKWRSISRANDVFNLSDAAPNEKPLPLLNVIILAYAYKNEYYETAWSMNGAYETPSCWAVNLDKKELTATSNTGASDPKVKPEELCSTCEHDVWGTGTGGTGKRCKNSIHLAVIPANFEDGDVPYSFQIVKSSISPFEKHLKMLKENGMHYLQTQTQFKFEGKKVLTGLNPAIPAVSPELLASLMPLREKAKEIVLQEPRIIEDEVPF